MDFLLTPWMKKYMYNILRALPLNLSNFRNMVLTEFWNFSTKKELKAIPKPIYITERSESQNEEHTLMWLDDRINPLESRMDWLAYSPIGRDVQVIWVKNFFDFKTWIQQNGLPTAICFDYELGDAQNNGYDCARWLVKYCQRKKLVPPVWSSQSTNPEGKAKINRLLKKFVSSL